MIAQNTHSRPSTDLSTEEDSAAAFGADSDVPRRSPRRERQDRADHQPRVAPGAGAMRLRRLARRAWQNKRASDLRQFGLTAAIIAATSVSTVAFALVSGRWSAQTSPLYDSRTSAILLFAFPLALILVLAVMHVRFLFLNGWHYNYAYPIRSRRGTPRNWYNAMKNIGDQREQITTEGLVKSFSLAWGARRDSMNLSFFFIAAAILALLSFLAAANRASIDPSFSQQIRNIVESVVDAYRSALAFAAASNPPNHISIDSGTAVRAYLAVPLVGLLYAFVLGVKAQSVRWALLPVTEMVWNFLYYYELYKNRNSAAYIDDDAQEDAYAWVMDYGLSVAPEEFFNKEGDVAFVEPSTVKEFNEFVNAPRRRPGGDIASPRS